MSALDDRGDDRTDDRRGAPARTDDRDARPRRDALRRDTGGADAVGRAMANAIPADELDHQRAMAAVKRGLFDVSGSSHAAVVVSRYVLLECIGTGGLGVVFAAFDPSLDRRVAIKLLQRRAIAGEDEDVARDRLAEEAQALAQLAHPNVVAVYDVGTYVLDRPPQGAQPRGVFLVMEFVDGEVLGSWVKNQPRSWREIVAMYVAAGRGLEAAHRAGIVHRDFKPSNVLVGHDGRARVLDFGLAHGRARASAPGSSSNRRAGDSASTGRDDAAAGHAATPAGGTPAYMSPEQHDGEPADARSDQFSFCVALFEAVTGGHPYAGATAQTIAHAKRTGAITNAAQPGIPRRLLAIIRKGLAPNPDDRHRDMAALLSALESAASRRRERIVASVLVVGAAVGATSALVRNDEAAVCSDFDDVAAETWDAQGRADVVAALTASGRSYGDETAAAVTRALDEYLGEWAKRRTAACEATFVRRGASASAMNRVTTCLDRNLARAGELIAVLRRAEEATTGWAVDAVDALPPFSACDRILDVTELTHTVETRAIEQSLVRAETLYETWELAPALAAATTVEQEATAGEHHAIAARAGLLVGRVHMRAGRLAAGASALWAAFAGAERVGDARVAAAALVELTLGAIDSVALVDAERFLALAQAKIGHHELGGGLGFDAHYALAKLARLRGDGELAVAAARLALEHAMGEFPAGHTMHGRAHTLLAITLSDIGDTEAARVELETAQEAYVSRLGPDHPHVANVIDLMASLDGQAGRYEAAMEKYLAAMTIRERALGPDHPEVGYSLANIAAVEQSLGRADASIEHGRRALGILTATRGEEDPEVAAVMSNLANVMLDLGSYAEALATADAAIAKSSRSIGADHPRTAVAIATGGIALTLLGRYDEAIARLETAREITAQRLGLQAPALPIIDKALAEAATAKGDLPAARAYIERSLAGFAEGVHDPRDRVGAHLLAILLASSAPTADELAALESEWIAAGRSAEQLAAQRASLAGSIALARARPAADLGAPRRP